MKKKKADTFKSLAIAFMAICMSTLYVLGPFHKEVSDLWHNAVHWIEPPNVILDHKTTDSIKTHVTHNHGNSLNEHEHGFIDFVSSLLENSNTNNAPLKSSSIDFKIDKHFIPQYSIVNHHLLQTLYIDDIWEFKKEPLKGYSLEFYVPPKQGLHDTIFI